MHTLQHTHFKSVLDVREQHESELTDTEWKVLDELTSE